MISVAEGMDTVYNHTGWVTVMNCPQSVSDLTIHIEDVDIINIIVHNLQYIGISCIRGGFKGGSRGVKGSIDPPF